MSALKNPLEMLGFGKKRAESKQQGDIGDGLDQRPKNGCDKPKGLFAQLSDEQRKRVLSYDGPVASGRSDLPSVSKR